MVNILEQEDMDTINVTVIDSAPQLEEAMGVRRRVFHQEQKIDPEMDVDGFDDECIHLLAYFNGKAVGTCWLLRTGPFMRLQRLAVDQEFRRKGIGTVLLKYVADYVRRRHSDLLLTALACVSAVKLYENAGWKYVDKKIIRILNMDHTIMILLKKTDQEIKNLLIMKENPRNYSFISIVKMKLAEYDITE